MNKHITAAAAIILVSGVIKAWSSNTPITRVVLGGYVFLLILSILDLFGGRISQLASALAMLAVVSILINQFPWSTVIGALTGKSTGTGAGSAPGVGAPAQTGGHTA